MIDTSTASHLNETDQLDDDHIEKIMPDQFKYGVYFNDGYDYEKVSWIQN